MLSCVSGVNDTACFASKTLQAEMYVVFIQLVFYLVNPEAIINAVQQLQLRYFSLEMGFLSVSSNKKPWIKENMCKVNICF